MTAAGSPTHTIGVNVTGPSLYPWGQEESYQLPQEQLLTLQQSPCGTSEILRFQTPNNYFFFSFFMFLSLINMFCINKASFRCTVASVLVLVFPGKHPHETVPSVPDMEMHSGLATPIHIPSPQKFPTSVSSTSGCKKHKGSAKAPQTISCLTQVHSLKHQRSVLPALVAKLFSYSCPSSCLCLQTFAHGESNCKVVKGGDLVSSVYSGKPPRGYCAWHSFTLHAFPCQL